MASAIPFYHQVIARQIKQLRILKDREGWGPAAKVKLETELVQAFYVVRKLIREGCVELELAQLQFPMKAYNAKPGKGSPDPGKSLKPHYVLKDAVPIARDVEFIAELFADNAVFDVVQAPDKRLLAMQVSSESEKAGVLYEISIQEVIELLEEVTTECAP